MVRRIGAAAAVAATLLGAGTADAKPKAEREGRVVDLQLLGVNDFHGNLEPPGVVVGGRETGGADALAGYLDRYRARDPKDTITVHAGDMVGGSPLVSSYFHDEPSVEAMNMMGFDVGTLGNHEFDEGGEEMLRLLRGGQRSDGRQFKDGVNTSDPGFEGASFPYVAANTVRASTGRTVLPPYRVVNRRGVKVGFIGVTTLDTPNIVLPDMVAPFRFLDLSDTVNRYVRELRRQKVETIVVLAHAGGQHKPPAAATGEIITETAQMSDAVDVVVAGHSHSLLNTRVGRKLVVQAFSYGTAFDAVSLSVDRKSRDVVRSSADIVTTFRDGIQPDPEVAGLVGEFRDRIAPVANRQVGTAAATITRTANPAGESPLGDLIADAQRAFAGTDLAFMNPGGIRADVEPGEVTYGELFSVQPFDNGLVRMTLSGAQVRQLLEQQFQPDRTRILQISGLRYAYDPARPAGQRIGAITLPDGRALDPAADYTAAVNGYIATGGDSFTVLKEGRGAQTVGGDLEALVEYVEGLAQPFSAPDPASERRIIRE